MTRASDRGRVVDDLVADAQSEAPRLEHRGGGKCDHDCRTPRERFAAIAA
jgi:hypothetical protein